MAHDNQLHIYIDRSVTPNIGISTDDISYVTAEDSDDIGVLCRSPKVNKYAKFKPTASTQKPQLTVQQQLDYNCGIDTTNLLFDNFGSCLTAAKQNCDWSKVTPTAYRFSDFDKYYQDAKQPYVGQIDIVGNTVIGGTSGMYIQLAIQHNTDTFQGVKVNMQVSDLYGLLNENYDIADYKYAFIYRDASNQSAQVNVVDIPLSSGETIMDGNNKYINVTFAMPSGSTYESVALYDCLFVAYVDDEGTYEMTFLPNTYFQVKLALFGIWNNSGTSIENTTIQVAQTGTGNNPIQLKFSGYEWNAEVKQPGLISATFSPSQGDSRDNYKNVTLTVYACTQRNLEQKVRSLVYVSAPGRVGTTGDFTKEFTIEQSCLPPASQYNIEIWQDGNKVNTLYITEGLGYELRFDIKYDTDWFVDRITYADTDQVTTDIYFTPTSRPAPPAGTSYSTFEDAALYGNVSLVAGTAYRIYFRNAQSQQHDTDIESIELFVQSAT